MLLVGLLKRIVSMREFFLAPKTTEKKLNHICMHKTLLIWAIYFYDSVRSVNQQASILWYSMYQTSER